MAFPKIPTGIESALLLYGCAYEGHNDGQFVRAAGVPNVTVVDIDQDAITKMAQSYPPGWKFVCQDAIEFSLVAWARDVSWDLVVADPYGGGDMERAHEKLGLLKSRARKMLIIGAYTKWWVPDDVWEVVDRSEAYCWWVYSVV